MAGGRHGGDALEMFTELFALEDILLEQEEEAERLEAMSARRKSEQMMEERSRGAGLGMNGTEAWAGS
ncbi:hypothetical protein D3C71_2064540 [compost metagenome]